MSYELFPLPLLLAVTAGMLAAYTVGSLILLLLIGRGQEDPKAPIKIRVSQVAVGIGHALALTLLALLAGNFLRYFGML